VEPKQNADSTDNTPQDTPDTSPGNTEGNTSGETLFTQADLDRIVGDRAKRAAEAAQNKLLEALGVEALDDAKSMLSAHRERQQAEMTEAEKKQAEIEKLQQKLAEVQAQAERERTERLNNDRNRVIERALRDGGGQDVDQLRIILQAQKADAMTGLFEDGTVTPEGDRLTAFVKQVQSDYPRYFATAGAGAPSVGGGVAPISRQAAVEDVQKAIKKRHGKL
jgi:hypothetical protein